MKELLVIINHNLDFIPHVVWCIVELQNSTLVSHPFSPPAYWPGLAYTSRLFQLKDCLSSGWPGQYQHVAMSLASGSTSLLCRHHRPYKYKAFTQQHYSMTPKLSTRKESEI